MNFNQLPLNGLPYPKVLSLMKQYSVNDANWKKGKTFSLVYHRDDTHTKFLQKAFELYFDENGLNPMAFKSLKTFEHEVVKMTAHMLHAPQEACGTMTSGGTESCLLAVKTYRDMAQTLRPWIKRPEMIVPESIHVAFEKGAEYFNVKIVRAPLDKDFKVDVKAVEKLINRKTILIIGSAPCYPYGVIDPIDELSKIAVKHKLPLHVDACVGGFLLPFIEEIGYTLPPYDFRIPGVTSISADVHKYGFSAKGASVIVYRSIEYLRHQFFIYEDWCGGVFASPALLGTRPGGTIAAAWAAMVAQGKEGYINNAKIIMQATKKIQQGIQSIQGMEILGTPHMSVFAYRSVDPQVNTFAIGDILEKKGWHVDRLQRPDALHAMITPVHTKVAQQFIIDLKNAFEYVKKNPHLAYEGGAAMYGMIAHIPMRKMIRSNILKMMEGMYGPTGQMPDLRIDESAHEDFATKAGKWYLKLRDKFSKK
ncbi:MAG: aminotransferase class V-fold PLP-dependent enzyme [Spirochaetota bacterium]